MAYGPSLASGSEPTGGARHPLVQRRKGLCPDLGGRRNRDWVEQFAHRDGRRRVAGTRKRESDTRSPRTEGDSLGEYGRRDDGLADLGTGEPSAFRIGRLACVSRSVSSGRCSSSSSTLRPLHFRLRRSCSPTSCLPAPAGSGTGWSASTKGPLDRRRVAEIKPRNAGAPRAAESEGKRGTCPRAPATASPLSSGPRGTDGRTNPRPLRQLRDLPGRAGRVGRISARA